MILAVRYKGTEWYVAPDHYVSSRTTAEHAKPFYDRVDARIYAGMRMDRDEPETDREIVDHPYPERWQ